MPARALGLDLSTRLGQRPPAAATEGTGGRGLRWRMVCLLNDVYDVEHRAYLMSEKKIELMPLKIRSHGASSVMQYDERYTPYIEMT
ncbi:mutator protein [Hordeum vulgare]|nr:mutator protein [Hordeum vulgare]